MVEEKDLIKTNNLKTKFTKNFLLSLTTAAVMVLIFSLGVAFGASTLVEPAEFKPGIVQNTDEIPEYLSEDVDFRQFWKVWEYIKENYVNEDIPETKLFYGAMTGLVSSLGDPYSVFFDPEISEKFEQELSGSFEGIGAEIGIRNNSLTIIAPLAGTPAQRAGLLPGDIILKIDDTDTTNIALDYAVSIIRGKKGTPVVLNVYRKGEDAPKDVTIVRDTIEIDSVKLSDRTNGSDNNGHDGIELLDGDIAYIELLYFNENTLADWNKTIQEVLLKNPKGIILDLRNNPGGFLSTAIEIAGDWADSQVVVSEKFRDGVEISHKANRQPRLNHIPTVVLVNGGSASGSEIVAGALQDYDLATIVGETTFGKGSVQDLKKFKDGSSVKLTIAEWLTPDGRNINQEGIVPDVIIERTPEDIDQDKDPQLDKALEILQQQ